MGPRAAIHARKGQRVYRTTLERTAGADGLLGLGTGDYRGTQAAVLPMPGRHDPETAARSGSETDLRARSGIRYCAGLGRRGAALRARHLVSFC